MVTARNWVGTSLDSPTLTVNLPMKVSTTSTTVSGDGILAISASVDATVTVTAYDETNVAKTTGGDIFYVHVLDRCSLNNNFYCEESEDSSNILTTQIMQKMTDNGDGTY